MRFLDTESSDHVVFDALAEIGVWLMWRDTFGTESRAKGSILGMSFWVGASV